MLIALDFAPGPSPVIQDEEIDMSSAIARSQSHTKADNRLFTLVNGPARFLEELSGYGADPSFA